MIDGGLSPASRSSSRRAWLCGTSACHFARWGLAGTAIVFLDDKAEILFSLAEVPPRLERDGLHQRSIDPENSR